MAGWLRQSTAVTVALGPFVDQTDGFTLENALTITSTDCLLSKNGAAFAVPSDTGAATVMSTTGHYAKALNATDTNTLGILRVFVNEAGALPVWEDYTVVTQNTWDSFFASDRLQVDVEEIGAGIITATAIAADAIGASELAADAATEIAAAVLAQTVDTFNTAVGSPLTTTATLKQALSILLGFAAGVTSANGATLSSPTGGATRITASIDGNNNRTAMFLTPST
jgi:hypothetical protein